MSYRSIVSIVILSFLLCVAIAIPAEANPGAPSENGVYIIAAGDTLLGIALRYGLSLAELQEANDISDANKIKIGQHLIIPGALASVEPPEDTAGDAIQFSAVHGVAGGETLNRIAARYGTTSGELVKINNLTDPNHLTVGQRLLVPGDTGAAIQVGFDAKNLPAPFVSLEMRSSEPVQGDTVLVMVETSEEVPVSGSFEGQEIKFAGKDRTHWGLIPIHPMAGLGPYDVRIKASPAGSEPVSIVGQIWVRAGTFDVENIVLPPSKNALLDRELILAEREKLGQALETTGPLPVWQGLMIYPVTDPVISSEFGTRRSYNGGPAASFHEGLDFDAGEGDPVMAAAGGQVVLAEELTVRGNSILIDHGLGVHTGYWHLSEIDVEAGQEVKAGDVIGKVGASGLSTGPHLHWEIRIGQVNVNPKQWTKQTFP